MRTRFALPGLFAVAGGALLTLMACSPAGLRDAAPPAREAAAPVRVAALGPGPIPGVAAPAPAGADASPAPAPDEAAEVLPAAARRAKAPVAVLQIGDSHTAADFFTGEVRRILQARYGDGGLGYLEVGKPHPGVHKVGVAVDADAGWSYSGIQRSADAGRFALSGFLAETSRAGQSLTFTSAADVPYTDIEIEVGKGPDQGAIDVLLDGRVATQASLQAAETARGVVRLPSRPGATAFRRLEIRTTTSKPVTVMSVGAYDRRRGLSYSNIGFPGATVDILNKFPQATVVEALHRLRPRVVVLSFGTNEGFNDDLDLGRYRERYEAVLRTIRSGAPDAEIVMIGPAYANRVPPDCRKTPDASACRGPQLADAARSLTVATGADCPYPTPPQLDRVRALQRDLAADDHVAFWDWSSIMPKHCGAEAWTTAVPRLMTSDHVHFTGDGYRKGGQAFASFLDPIIDKSLRDLHAVSND